MSHIETFPANLQNLENNIKPIKTKTKLMEMYPGISKMFKTATGFDPDDSLPIFKSLSTDRPHENAKFYDSQAKRDLKKYMQNVKQLGQNWLHNNNYFMVVLHTKVLSLPILSHGQIYYIFPL